MDVDHDRSARLMNQRSSPKQPKKPMPPHPRELGATRFFARIVNVDLECPKCGKVFTLRRANVRRISSRTPGTWDPSTSTFTCTGKDGCQRKFVLGVLAWDKPRGITAGAVPADQVPNIRQLAALRAEGDGWWMPEGTHTTGRMDHSNLATVEKRPEPEEEEYGDEEVE